MCECREKSGLSVEAQTTVQGLQLQLADANRQVALIQVRRCAMATITIMHGGSARTYVSQI